MKRMLIFLLFILLGSSLSAHAHDREFFYEPSKKTKTYRIANLDEYNRVAYQVLRHAENHGSKELRKETSEIWQDFKDSHLTAEKKSKRLKDLFKSYADEVTYGQLQTAKRLGPLPP